VSAHRNIRRILVGSISAASATLVLAGCSSSSSTDTASTPTSSPTASASTPTPAPESDASTGTYRDGEYTATGEYGGAPSHHDVTLTIQDDLITDVTITTPAEDPTSLEYQRGFAAALPDAVLGRNIDDVQIDRLGGASSSPEGFMNALEQIKADAAA
jgi:uncharacterized protein with FMN-binding domain